MAFNGVLCDGTNDSPPQRQAVDQVLRFMKRMRSTGAAQGMVVAPTGTGKTVMGLAVASELGPDSKPELRYKTAVVCHRTELMVQWKERINQFMPKARVGFVQGPEFDVVGKDIVVIMIDSLLSRGERPEDQRRGKATDKEAFMKAWEAHMTNPRRTKKGKIQPKSTLPPGFPKYPAFLLRQFGFVLYDEGHHLAAKGYSKALGYLPSLYSLTLTATPKKSGKVIPQLFYICGPVIVQFPRAYQHVKLKAVRYENGETQVMRFRGDIVAIWEMQKDLAYDFDRNARIVEEVKLALHAKRHVLIFTERVKHSIFLVRRLQGLRVGHEIPEDPKRPQVVGWYTPSYPREVRRRELNARVIVTTYQYASEGMDVKTLDTLILASPRSEMEQIVGRIFRPCPDKQTPYIIDIFEDFYDYFSGMWRKRYRFYKDEGYAMEMEDHVVSERVEDDEDGDEAKAEHQKLLDDIPSDEEEVSVYEIDPEGKLGISSRTGKFVSTKPGSTKPPKIKEPPLATSKTDSGSTKINSKSTKKRVGKSWKEDFKIFGAKKEPQVLAIKSRRKRLV
jgi:superfamily II DNA or RNA helicase